MELTVVSKEVVYCDYQLVVLFTDDTIKNYRLPNGKGSIFDIEHDCLWKTADAIQKLVFAHNQYRQAINAANLHAYKEAKYGHNYQARGY